MMKKTLYITACATIAEGGGIYRCCLDAGQLTVEALYPCDRPMYTVYNGGRLHILLRQPLPETGAYFSITPDFTNPSQLIDSQGIVPCHLAADGDAVWWVNYLSGNVVGKDGTVTARSGCGPNAKRQDMPHTHFVQPIDARRLGVCDLGTDTLALYDRQLNLLAEAAVPAGYGIRHFVQDSARGLLYAVNEMVPSVSVFTCTDHGITCGQTILLPCANPAASGAAIRLSADRQTLYVSIREENVIFSLDVSGEPRITAKLPCFGDSPRDFDIMGDYLIATNEKSNSVTVLSLQGECCSSTTFQAPLCVTCLP
ncbi:MAG: beta-propeller fold lactonase family protein [Clostridia bacterium]|nr:beta-propeller fold lactonase family protein [Clostridia bacterium]